MADLLEEFRWIFHSVLNDELDLLLIVGIIDDVRRYLPQFHCPLVLKNLLSQAVDNQHAIHGAVHQGFKKRGLPLQFFFRHLARSDVLYAAAQADDSITRITLCFTSGRDPGSLSVFPDYFQIDLVWRSCLQCFFYHDAQTIPTVTGEEPPLFRKTRRRHRRIVSKDTAHLLGPRD